MSFFFPKVPVGLNVQLAFPLLPARHMRTVSKCLASPHDIPTTLTKHPLGECTIELAHAAVDCGGSRLMCMLSGVASSELAPAELRDSNTTAEPA